MQPHEVAFLGVQTAPSRRSEKVEFPVAIGLGLPDLRQTRTLIIRPNEDWDIFADREGGKDERVSGYSKKRLLSEGMTTSDAITSIAGLIGDRSLFGIWREREASMLRTLFGTIAAPKLLSALGMFHRLASNERFTELEIRHKLNAHYYPRNAADVRWMIVCFSQCHHRYV
jgi:hypothetical protein